MNYKLVSSKYIIARVYNDFNIDHSDWIERAVEWIGQAISYMGIYNSLEPKKECATVVNYRAYLPCDLKVLLGIEYDGYRLPLGSWINEGTTPTQEVYPIVNTIFSGKTILFEDYANLNVQNLEEYELLNNGQIKTTFESGDIKFYYLGVPTEKDEIYNINLPLVPDNEKVAEALTWYVIMKLLQRGYKHPLFDWLTAKKMWEIEYPKAKNSVSMPDVDMRQLMSEVNRTFIINPNAWGEAFYKE